MSDPSSQKPYLIRAIYEWCVDNSFTPYIAVTVDADTRVPMEYVRNGEIVLNVGPLAANRLRIGNDFIDFAARFGGVTKDILVPIVAVAAIYARENGLGMSFEVAAAGRAHRPQLDTVSSRSKGGESRALETIGPAPLREVPASNTSEKSADKKDGDDDTDPKPFGGGRPVLRRVK
jgi:stringent starvation protein B